MSYSVIIPTMYFHVSKLQQMITVYDSIDSIKEILIVNNFKENSVKFNSDKVREIGNGNNIYVNPSWKLGAKEATCENIILANDDILIKGDLKQLLYAIDLINSNSKVFGPAKTCYTRYGAKVSPVKLQRANTSSKFIMNYGFGVFMILRKELFLNTNIPNDFLVWYGDHILFLRNEPWEFTGLVIETAMKGTTAKINLKGFAEREKKAFNNLFYE